MEFFRIKRDIPFMRHALLLNAISAALFGAAVFFLITRGLHRAIECTGGTVRSSVVAPSATVSTRWPSRRSSSSGL
ncbi:MAG: protein translocase subunit SecF, partial [Caldimonas sp.]